MNGNSVNTLNSARRLRYTAGDLLLGSRRARGRPQLCAGAGMASSWLPLASWPSFKGRDAVVVILFSSSIFQSPPPTLRRALAVDLAPVPSQQSAQQLRLLLAHLANQLWSLDFTGNRRSPSFFLTAGSTTVASVSPWPALSGEPLLLLSVPLASPCSYDAL